MKEPKIGTPIEALSVIPVVGEPSRAVAERSKTDRWLAGGVGLGAGGVMIGGALVTGAALISAPVAIAVVAGAGLGWATKKIISPSADSDADGSDSSERAD